MKVVVCFLLIALTVAVPTALAPVAKDPKRDSEVPSAPVAGETIPIPAAAGKSEDAAPPAEPANVDAKKENESAKGPEEPAIAGEPAKAEESSDVIPINAVAKDKKKADDTILLSVSMGTGAPYCDLTENNHKAYAEKHGYKYHRYHDSDMERLGVTGNVKWGKMKGLQEVMDGTHRYVVWIDCDMVVTNTAITIESIVAEQSSGQADMLIARDSLYRVKPDVAGINTGIFIFKDTPWSRGFVDDVTAKGKVPGTFLEDQPRFIMELVERGEMDAVPVTEKEVHRHVVVVPQRVMNSFLREGYDDPEETKWQPGDFIAHVNGMKNDKRIEKINKVLSQVTLNMKQSLLKGIDLGDGMLSLIQAAGDLPVDVSDMITKAGAADRFEDNWKAMMVTALEEGDWETVAKLQA